MVIPPEERFSVPEKISGQAAFLFPNLRSSHPAFLIALIPRRKNAAAGFSAFLHTLLPSDVFCPAMTVYRDRRLPSASPGDRSPISFFKLSPSAEDDCREKAPILMKQKDVPVFRRENRSCRRLFPLLFPIKNPRRLGSRREFSKRERINWLFSV